MGKKEKKGKKKKVNPKRERYSKFHKEKSSAIDVSMPDLAPEQQKQKQTDEEQINRFLRFSRNVPSREIVERRMKSKRVKLRG